MAEKKKFVNRPRRERKPGLLRPEFALTGIVTGGVGGMVIGLIMEVALGRPQQIIMVVTGLVGLALGLTVETIRYAWRLWRWNVAKARQSESREGKS